MQLLMIKSLQLIEQNTVREIQQLKRTT